MDAARKALKPLLVVTLVATVALFAAGRRDISLAKGTLPSDLAIPADPPAQPAPPTAAPLILECYSLDGGNDPQAPALLITKNFGTDLVRVRRLVLMCEEALKFTTAPPSPVPLPPVGRVFACYRIAQGRDIDDPYSLETANFGPDKVIVGRANLMCESAVKQRPDRPNQPPSPPFEMVLQCYNLREGDDPQKPVTLVTRNFGPDEVVVRQAVIMCEDAAKQRPGTPPFGQPTGAVWECYRLQRGDEPRVPAILVTRNFQTDDVRIVRATLMCEFARKTPLFDTRPNDDPTPLEPGISDQ